MATRNPRLSNGGLLLLLGAVAPLAVAFAAQYWGGLQPCELCIWQRYAHLAVIAVAAIALLLPPAKAQFLFTLGAGSLLLMSAGLALFHVGVEWKWWQGPSACSGGSLIGLDPKEAARRLMETPLVRCDEIAWSLLGVSMAGYNFLISLIAALAVAIGLTRDIER